MRCLSVQVALALFQTGRWKMGPAPGLAASTRSKRHWSCIHLGNEEHKD
jgi:hypothetical protein